VIGGGIAGIQSALDIADAGFEVYLLEKEPSIGGRMAQLDKTFPTLDCSACILTPKMVDVAHHPKIRLITYAELEEVSGYIGNFKVKIRKKPRYVDEEKCTGCGQCASVCPMMVLNDFDENLGTRSAIYVPFPQAVPLKYTRELESCMGCGLCKVACEPGAIDFDQREEEIELEVGTISVATGYDLFDATKKPEYKYGIYDNVITGLEFERLVSASGPTAGKILIGQFCEANADRFPEGAVGRFPEGKSDSPSPNRHFIEPKSLVFIQCVGSRDDKTNPYCSRVCCMYTAKQAHLARDKIPGAEITVFYMDIRAFGKGFEEFHDRVREEDIIYRRGNVGDIFRKDGQLIVRAEDTSLGEIVEIPTDLVVLAVGMVPKSDTKEIARLLRISRSADGFFLEAHPKLRPVDTATDGIFVAGCCQGPKDIPDTVAQASAVAAKAILVLLQDKIKAEGTVVFVNDEICSACRTCEKVCVYGALSLDEEKEVMLSNDALCKGCGACVSTCPSGAIEQKGFKNDQFFAIVDATLSG
jgi:heterodisulfide reductase subunit A